MRGFLRQNPEKFILGVRDFSDKTIPFRSRFGNHCTTLVFRLFCGLDISDTQTGLKGIPVSFIPPLMETPGERCFQSGFNGSGKESLFCSATTI